MDSSSLAALSDADRLAYATYCRVRDEVLRMKDRREGPGESGPSRYWAQELDQIDYLIDASPLVVRKLRHHAFQITGIRPYDYREAGEKRAFFERRLRALVALAGGSTLLVEEHDALGGFGFTIEGRRYNVDTLKFFEVLVGMQRAGVLEPFRATDRRRIVLEIGAGWGGFAYQFKTLFPKTTYVIVDFPELFLFSATYLLTVFPEAKVRFWQAGQRTFEESEDVDFVFVPVPHADAVLDARPDLLVNLVSFQEMTTSQVERYTELAAATGCQTLYSLNRDRSVYNDEIESVSAILSRRYDLREVSVLGSGYLKATKRDSAISVDEARRTSRVDDTGYRHLAGTLKPEAARGLSGAHAAPLVGIGVTLRNRALYLSESLDSLLAQTHAHFQLVLVDDGSTDGTEAIARAYAERDSRVRYVRFPERRGMVAAWRAAFEEATAGGVQLLRLGQRPRPMASEVARDARCHPRGVPRRRRRLPADAADQPGRCAHGEAGAAVRDIRRHGSPRALEALQSQRLGRRGRHGVRPHARQRGSRRRRVSGGPLPGSPAAGRTDPARPDPSGARGPLVSPAIRHRQRRAPALDTFRAGGSTAIGMDAPLVSPCQVFVGDLRHARELDGGAAAVSGSTSRRCLRGRVRVAPLWEVHSPARAALDTRVAQVGI